MLITQTNLRVTALKLVSRAQEVNVRKEVNTIEPYAFEPVETDSGGEGSGSEDMVSESSSNSENTRLQHTNCTVKNDRLKQPKKIGCLSWSRTTRLK